MGRMLQKKKNRSSVPRATKKPKSKRLPVKSSPLVADKWDIHLTLSQNYRRLGLASKLNSRSGGTEIRSIATVDSKSKPREGQDHLAVTASKPSANMGLKTAKIVRDEDGRILRVIHDEEPTNPLNDPLNAIDGSSEDLNPTTHAQANQAGVVMELKAAARSELAQVMKRKKPRKQSTREREWIEQLVGKFGKNVKAMSKDRKLNPNQQTEADIKKRIEMWEASR